jgi:hypothetical protein
MGKPSMRVAAVVSSPGIFSKIEVIAPPVKETAESVIMNGRAVFGARVKTKGRKRASPARAPIPGIIPIMRPAIVPPKIAATKDTSEKYCSACRNASKIILL